MAHPQLTVLASLLSSTCFCPHNWFVVPNATCFAWLCEVIERSVLTMLLPVDAGWAHVPDCTREFLFDHPDVAAVAISGWILGPLTLTDNCTTPSGVCSPVGVAAVQPASFREAAPDAPPFMPASPADVGERGGMSAGEERSAGGTTGHRHGSGYHQRRQLQRCVGVGVTGPIPIGHDDELEYPHSAARLLAPQSTAQSGRVSPGELAAGHPAGTSESSLGSGARQLHLGQVNSITGDRFDDPVDWTTHVDAYGGCSARVSIVELAQSPHP